MTAVPTDPPPRPAGPSTRPVSPHLQIWRWHVTMAASILNRASGVGLYVGALGLVAWLWALAAGPEPFRALQGFLGAPLGLLILFGLTVAAAYHLAAGVRHLVWDSGRGFEPRTADMTAWISIAFAIVAPLVLFWAASR